MKFEILFAIPLLRGPKRTGTSISDENLGLKKERRIAQWKSCAQAPPRVRIRVQIQIQTKLNPKGPRGPIEPHDYLAVWVGHARAFFCLIFFLFDGQMQ